MDVNDVFNVTVIVCEDGGYDVIVEPKDDMKVVVCDNEYDKVTMKVRDVALPRVGSRRKIGGHLVKVNDIEVDSAGHVFIISDSGEKLPWA